MGNVALYTTLGGNTKTPDKVSRHLAGMREFFKLMDDKERIRQLEETPDNKLCGNSYIYGSLIFLCKKVNGEYEWGLLEDL